MTQMIYPGVGDLDAHWIDRSTIVWPRSLGQTGTWFLVASPLGGLARARDSVVSANHMIELFPKPQLSWGQRRSWPHLCDELALEVGIGTDLIRELLTGQVGVLRRDPCGELTKLTGLQIGGVLDDLYATEEPLGVTWSEDVPEVGLWAPTARSVRILVHDQLRVHQPIDLPMQRTRSGVWRITGTPQWKGQPYNFAVEVFVPATGRVETNLVTDPYSHGLSVGSRWSVFVDLDDPATWPPLWADTPNPPVIRDVDHTIYELHVRDFSIGDQSIPSKLRGTYAAFTTDCAGMRHMKKLVAAGLTTIHLLPTFDIASITEERSLQHIPQIPDAPPASVDQQSAVMASATGDGFNWGYDPLHYATPEGSYATDDNQYGAARVMEFREMVGAVHREGLRVVLDQVFNHTMASGQDEHSVLDRIVPGYYHRLDGCGQVESSTCCANIATERRMAERLMVDSVMTWARCYRVDGFRFDLMGHHSRANMIKVKNALSKLTLAEHGVDGKAIFLYGEGWNFGEVANNRLFHQASQGQLNGTGIATFSDRLRDGVTGGHRELQHQGLATGLFTDNSSHTGQAGEEHRIELGRLTDLVKLGLAGNLADYRLVTSSGEVLEGRQLNYNGQPAGYASQPGEVVTYVDAHDNETLYDLLVLKLPDSTSMIDRIRMNTLALATCALAQTPCFWHGGTDLLRSKSLDRNSFDSGDHFNAIDWTMQTSSFGRGLPPSRDNQHNWQIMAPLLTNPDLVPSPEQIRLAHEMALELLRLRWSSPLFRLGDAALIRERVSFPASGANARPGLILMFIDDRGRPKVIDPNRNGILVAFNASPWCQSEEIPELAGRNLSLSTIQRSGIDPVIKQTSWDSSSAVLRIPGRSVAVLVEQS